MSNRDARPLLTEVAYELERLGSGATALEDVLAAGAERFGGQGLIQAQYLDHHIQVLKALAGVLHGLGRGQGPNDILDDINLADLAARLKRMGAPEADAATPVAAPSSDPELF